MPNRRLSKWWAAPVVVISISAIAIVAILFLPVVNNGNSGNGEGDGIDADFSCEGHYDCSNLFGMGHPFVNETNITRIGGYVEGVHQGIDFFYKNLTNVVAAAPGYVEYIASTYWSPPLSPGNAYSISLRIRFNATVMINYGFEMWTTEEYFCNLQLSLLTVEVGDWVSQGTIIGQFVSCNSSAHIDWSVHVSGTRVPPCQFYNSTEYTYLNDLYQIYVPGGELCS